MVIGSRIRNEIMGMIVMVFYYLFKPAVLLLFLS